VKGCENEKVTDALKKTAFILIVSCTAGYGPILQAQQTVPPHAAPAASHPTTAGGVTPEYDVRRDLTTLAEQTRRFQPLLAQVKPEKWIENGAPEAYVRQLRSCQANVQSLIAATDQLAREPERLTVALDAYFRMQNMESLVGSLRDGIRKYQNAELAGLLSGALADNANNREKLRQHIIDLAAAREQELQIMDQEAQRCRGMLLRQPVTSTSKTDRGQQHK
jgi:hypothetical protein